MRGILELWSRSVVASEFVSIASVREDGIVIRFVLAGGEIDISKGICKSSLVEHEIDASMPPVRAHTQPQILSPSTSGGHRHSLKPQT